MVAVEEPKGRKKCSWNRTRMYVCMYMYVYIYIYIYIFVSIHIYIYVYVWTDGLMDEYIYIIIIDWKKELEIHYGNQFVKQPLGFEYYVYIYINIAMDEILWSLLLC